MASAYAVAEVSDLEFVPSSKSATPTGYLTERLGATEFRATVRRLPPGRAMPYHVHERQEELYLGLSGPCSVLVDGDRVDLTPPGAVSVPPETPRQLFNAGDREAAWVVVGAPPVEDDGTVLGPGPAAELV